MYTETMQKVFSNMLIDTLLDWDDWSADEAPHTFVAVALENATVIELHF